MATAGGGGKSLDLPVVDLASSDLGSAAEFIRKACVEYGFFYVVNHGVEEGLLEKVFAESRKFFEQPMEEKMALKRNSSHLGYTPCGADKLDASSKFKGDLNENFCVRPIGVEGSQNDANQWPSIERFPCWKETIKLYHATAKATGNRILSLIALSLNLNAEFFDCPIGFLRLLHYPGEVNESDDGNYGTSAHSDFGILTLLATDGTPGLQICREKDKHPQLWEDVHHIDGSTLHRVVAVGKERYSVAFFLDPDPDLVVQCLESCCSEECPPSQSVNTDAGRGRQQAASRGGGGRPEMAAGAGNRLDLPVVDLASPDLGAAAESVRKACVESGFFYVVNHGLEEGLLEKVFEESRRFFELPMEEKMALLRNSNHRGYTPPYAEKLDPSSKFEGDLKESFYIGAIGDESLQDDANQYPSEEHLPSWKETFKLCHATALDTSKRILSLIALSLDLEAEFFENIGAFSCPSAALRLLHYPGEVDDSDDGNYGASAHSDYGMITLLATDGTPGLQICREKDRHPQLWEDVHHIDGSTVHRVVAVGKERYSVAFFLDPNPDLVVKCLESCCSEICPPRFPPVKSARGGGGDAGEQQPEMAACAGNRLDLPVVELASPDLGAAAESVRKACVESGFFYVVNHGVEEGLLEKVFVESRRFFELPMEEKMALLRNSNHRGYTPPYAEKLDPSSKFEGDLKESFYIGPIGDEGLHNDANQWPSEVHLPSWKDTIKMYHATALATGKRILSLIALSLNLNTEFFENIGAFICPSAFLRLLHYPAEVDKSDDGNYGASAHSDYGMITLLATDGTPGLQICREKDRHPQLWEDVHHIDGALIVNIGDLLERSTVHRVVAVGKERYSVAFFLDPNPDLVVRCLESCSSETCPPSKPLSWPEPRLLCFDTWQSSSKNVNLQILFPKHAEEQLYMFKQGIYTSSVTV
uniref:Fe2OG dioxygenase domain-containing protein n=1 Tax=Leersia perrieri TaxID=77586 RepID=A0A0D9XLQ1_9ORYZ